MTADALSRPPSIPPGDAYCPEQDVVAAAKLIVTTELTPQNILKAQAACGEVINHLSGKKNPTIKLKYINYRGYNLLCEVTNRPRPFIPKELRDSVYQACHDIDHAGQAESKRRVKSAYFWPKLQKDVAKYVKTCHSCQSIKPKRKYVPKPKTFKVPDRRFSHLHVDVVGPLLESEGMSYILSILDRKTRWLECIAMPAANAKNVCNAFIRGWLQRYGKCDSIICDNGNTFIAKLWTDLQRVLGVEVVFVPRYHQSTNGAVERQHRTIKESIKASLVQMGNTHRDQWMTQLPFTLLGRRVALQPDLGASPADYVLGTAPVERH